MKKILLSTMILFVAGCYYSPLKVLESPKGKIHPSNVSLQSNNYRVIGTVTTEVEDWRFMLTLGKRTEGRWNNAMKDLNNQAVTLVNVAGNPKLEYQLINIVSDEFNRGLNLAIAPVMVPFFYYDVIVLTADVIQFENDNVGPSGY